MRVYKGHENVGMTRAFQSLRAKRYVASVLLVLCDALAFMGIGLTFSLMDPSLTPDLPWTVPISYAIALCTIMMLLFKYDFYTCYHCQQRHYQNKVIGLLVSLCTFFLLCTVIVLQHPVDTLPALVMIFGFMGYVLCSRLVATVFFKRREKVVYWGDHIDIAMACPETAKAYLVGQVVCRDSIPLDFTIYKRVTDHQFFTQKYRFHTLIIDDKVLCRLNLTQFQELLIEPIVLRVFDTQSGRIRRLNALELMQATQEHIGVYGTQSHTTKQTVPVVLDGVWPKTLRNDLISQISTTDDVNAANVHCVYLHCSLDDEHVQKTQSDIEPIAVQNALRQALTEIDKLSTETHIIVVSQFRQGMSLPARLLQGWLELAYQHKAAMVNASINVVRLDNTLDDVEHYLEACQASVSHQRALTLFSPEQQVRVHTPKQLHAWARFIHQLCERQQSGMYRIENSASWHELMLMEHMILAEALSPKIYAQNALRTNEVVINFSRENALSIRDDIKQLGKGTQWKHVIELPQSPMTRTQFNQTMHWLLSQEAAAHPLQMLSVLQGGAIPYTKETDRVVNVAFGEIFTQGI